MGACADPGHDRADASHLHLDASESAFSKGLAPSSISLPYLYFPTDLSEVLGTVQIDVAQGSHHARLAN